MNLIGDSSYKKYVELVCGMILIIILLNPVTKLLSLDETFFYNWNLSNYKIESMDKSRLLIAEKKQKEKMQKEYTNQLKDQIEILVEEEGRYLTKLDIRYKEDSQGVIEKLIVWVSPEKKKMEEDIKIEPVIILGDEKGKKESEKEKINQIEENIKNSLMKTYQLKEKQVKVYEN